VPDSSQSRMRSVRLGFDPTFSSHFYIFEFQLFVDDEDVACAGSHAQGVEIYSSETGVWCHKQTAWSSKITPQPGFKSVFVNGVLYVIATEWVIGGNLEDH